MAATEKKTMRFYQSEDGSRPPTRTVQIAASQGIWMPGAPCFIDTSGLAELADTADGTGDVIHGFLLGTITSEAAVNTEFRMSVARPGDIYQVYLETGGTDLAESQTYVGEQYGLTISTTAGEIGYASLDVGNANAHVQVVDIMSNLDPVKFDTSTAPGVALVKILPATINATRAP